jgi:NAD(P)-dependent dehydrogenase (short-subunit alcohol dehydrogenase family)
MTNPGHHAASTAPAQTLRGQTVVITGASRGLGAACARAFAAEGCQLILIARDRSALTALADELASEGAEAQGVVLDVTDAAAVQDFFEKLPRCDVLINNAGGNHPQAFIEVDLPTLDALLNLNVRAMFVTAQAATRVMLRQPPAATPHAGIGCIIHMSSQMGHVGAPNRSVYCLTKHAIEGLTKAMAVELAPLGIRVNAVAPTFIETPLTQPFFEDPAFKADTLSRIPLGRLGEVHEVAAAVRFLASPAASLITGTSLLVDGGYTAR